ncbi:hypothetical protein IM543_13155 [Massilia sp. UMI-21]|nr:hypothetical protein IM543_13155 [Massilia sp. UMI-21]
MPIKPILSMRSLAALLVATGLVACATPPASQDAAGQASTRSANPGAAGTSGTSWGTSSAQGGMMGPGMTGSHGACAMTGGAGAGTRAGCPMAGGSQASGAGAMQQTNREQMCSMYRGMRDAPNEQARQGMMEQYMPAMSPEMRQRHMEMMQQQCQ